MEVTWIGTGTCVPRLDRRGPCTLVRCGGAKIVVDLGLGSLHGLLERGLRHTDLDAVLITHLHPDHLAELVSFLFAANYDEAPRKTRLVLAGGSGFSAYLTALSSIHGHWLVPKGYDLRVVELSPGGEVELEGVRCHAGAVRHIPSSLAYRFEWAGRSLVIAGDTGPSPELEDFARSADLLVLEASQPAGAHAPGHLTARQAGELAARAGSRRLALCHFYPSAEGGLPEEEASRAFDGPVTIADDGATTTV